ncbi:MAG: hypothetical protein OHK0024_23750 [Thalassobaculales bacterium]
MQQGFLRLRDRMSVRQQTAWMAGVLCVATALAVAAAAADLARRQAVRDAEAELVMLARTMATRLDLDMSERYRELRNVAGLVPLRPVWGGEPETLRGVLEQIRVSLPDYAWIGLAAPDGTVRAATRGMLEGASVAQRPWFINGLKGPTVEDVHDAMLLDRLLRTAPDQAPFRFVDVAVPVYGTDGALAGVLGAHLSWSWAEAVSRKVLSAGLLDLRPELLVHAADGAVLIGPQDAVLPADRVAAARQRAGLTYIDHSGPEPMLTAVVPTARLGDYPGLGWLVVARSPEALALAPANRLFGSILAVGAAAAALAVLLAQVLASHTMRPLEYLCAAIDRVGRDSGVTTVPWQRGSRDVVRLSAAVRSLLRRLGSAEAAERQAREAIAAAETRATAEARQAEEFRRRVGQDLDALRRLAETDPLTGLLNRRAFLGEAEQVLALQRGQGGPAVAVLMVDIDHFKRVNDVHGHAAGDQAIRTVGQVIHSKVRESDRVARFGGEEFVVLMRDADEAGAVGLAERMRLAIAGTPIIAGGAVLHVTASIGLALASGEDRDIEDLIARADRALYGAKSAGRNRVTSAAAPTVRGAA